jgi:ABC-2 type transport system ATP-binding protein
VLILDEPASDLDPRARIEMRDLLLELRELGKTIFLSSHILTELSDVCTAIGILERGALVVAGPIGEIAERLERQRSAQALGLDPATAPPVVSQSFTAPERVPTTQRLPDTTLASAGSAAPAPAPVVPQAPVTTEGGVPIPSATRKRLKLRVIGDARAVTPLIAGGGGVLGVDAGPGGQLLVHYTGDDRFVADVVRHLVANGVGIVGVEPERNELERIFLEVTRGDLQ